MKYFPTNVKANDNYLMSVFLRTHYSDALSNLLPFDVLSVDEFPHAFRKNFGNKGKLRFGKQDFPQADGKMGPDERISVMRVYYPDKEEAYLLIPHPAILPVRLPLS